MLKQRFVSLLILCIVLLLAVVPVIAFQESDRLIQDGKYEEKFDDEFWDRGWESRILIGNPNLDYFRMARKRLSMNLPHTELSALITNPELNFSDVRVEATLENVRTNDASYGIVCRASEDGWYELRIAVSGGEAGSYKLLKYDAYLKDQYKNPYVLVHKGMDRYFTGDIKLGINQKNTLGLLCEGDEFKIFINDKEQFPIKNGKLTDDQFAEGAVGFAVQTYGKGISDIDITKFSASEP